MKPTMTEPPQDDAQDTTDTTESAGIDGIIERVDSYIANPELVTPETLAELKGELEDLKSYLDGETTDADSTGSTDNQQEGKGGLSIIIGKMRGNKE